MYIYYFRIWLRLTLSSFQTAFVSRFGASVFILAKLLRFSFFTLVVYLIVSQTKQLAGYTLGQSMIFFLTYNVIDNLSQLLFRQVYRFRPRVVSGDFDLDLILPISPLFKSLLGGADALDGIVLIPYLALLIYFINANFNSITSLFLYILLVVNGLLISLAFHIAVLAIGVVTTEIDHAIMIYRDVVSMGRFPVGIYTQPLRDIITFIIPVGIMMSFPPEALFGILKPSTIVVAVVIGCILVYLSYILWKRSLRSYASASS